MKPILLFFAFGAIHFSASSQEFKLLKSAVQNLTRTDSMFYMDEQKIIPFKDSGVVVVGYGDSVVPGGTNCFALKSVPLTRTSIHSGRAALIFWDSSPPLQHAPTGNSIFM
jgi:hypothetical protein